MKPIHLLPPATALVLAATWLGSQGRTISTVEKQSAVLQRHITAAKAAAQSETSKTNAAIQAANDKQPIDWKKLAAQIEESRSGVGMPDVRFLMRLQQRLMSMDKHKLLAALDEIAALDLPENSRAMLKQMLIGPLAEKDPELALTHFIGKMKDDQNIAWQLAHIFGNWAKTDPIAATAWLDRQIAAGNFESKKLDGKSEPRMRFDGSLISILLASDPAAASGRLAAFPMEERCEVLLHNPPHFSQLKPEAQAAYARLVREQLPDDQQTGVIASMVNAIPYVDDYYANADELMKRIEASPDERNACIEKAAEFRIQQLAFKRMITRDDLEELRTWTQRQSPEITERATGKAIASAAGVGFNGESRKFDEFAELALEYHAASGNDEVLIPLLKSWPAMQDKNKEQARALANKLADEKRREELLRRFK